MIVSPPSDRLDRPDRPMRRFFRRRRRTALLRVCAAVLCLAPGTMAAEDSKGDNPLARRITGSADYVPFFGVRASVSDGLHIAGLLAVDAGLDVPDTGVHKRVLAQRARIADAMRAALADYAYRTHIPGEPPDARIIKRRLQRAIDKQLGKGAATVSLASLIIFDD